MHQMELPFVHSRRNSGMRRHKGAADAITVYNSYCQDLGIELGEARVYESIPGITQYMGYKDKASFHFPITRGPSLLRARLGSLCCDQELQVSSPLKISPQQPVQIIPWVEVETLLALAPLDPNEPRLDDDWFAVELRERGQDIICAGPDGKAPRDLAIQSLLMRAEKRKPLGHLPMLDLWGKRISAGDYTTLKGFLGSFGVTKMAILASGRSFHVYGRGIIPPKRLSEFVMRASKLDQVDPHPKDVARNRTKLVDPWWLAFSLMRGKFSLRASAESDHYHQIPTLMNEVDIS